MIFIITICFSCTVLSKKKKPSFYYETRACCFSLWRAQIKFTLAISAIINSQFASDYI